MDFRSFHRCASLQSFQWFHSTVNAFKSFKVTWPAAAVPQWGLTRPEVKRILDGEEKIRRRR